MTFHPYTTDVTPEGERRARNSLRLRLWSDDYFTHKWMCHPHSDCDDGCTASPIPERLAFYQSDIEAGQ